MKLNNMTRRLIGVFLRFTDAAAIAGAAGAAVSLGAIPILVLAEIFTRTTLGLSLGVSWEYATYFMSLVFLLGAAFTLRTGGHIRVSVLPLGANKSAAVTVEFISSSVGATMAVFLAMALSDLAWHSFIRGVVSATPAQTPLFLPMAGAAIGAWLLALQMAARVVSVLARVPVESEAPDADKMSIHEPPQ